MRAGTASRSTRPRRGWSTRHGPPGNGCRVSDIACIRPIDPRVAVLFGLAQDGGLAGDGIRFARALEAAIRERIKPLPLNIDGALAAILVDLGFPAMVGKLLFIVGRVAGLSAEVLEEYSREKPMRIKIPTSPTTACRRSRMPSDRTDRDVWL